MNNKKYIERLNLKQGDLIKIDNALFIFIYTGKHYSVVCHEDLPAIVILNILNKQIHSFFLSYRMPVIDVISRFANCV